MSIKMQYYPQILPQSRQMSQGSTHGRNWEQLSQRCSHVTYTSMSPSVCPESPLSFSMDFWQAALKWLYKLGQCRHFQQRNFRQANWDCLDGDPLPDGLHPLTRAALPNSSHEGRLALWHFLVQCPVPTRAGKNQAMALLQLTGLQVWVTHFCPYLSRQV